VPAASHGGADVGEALKCGAARSAINTAAVRRRTHPLKLPSATALIPCAVDRAKRRCDGSWEAYTITAREHTGRDVRGLGERRRWSWCGEILLTLIDQGTRKGLRHRLTSRIAGGSPSVIAAAGSGARPISPCGARWLADAVAVARALHYRRLGIAVSVAALSAPRGPRQSAPRVTVVD